MSALATISATPAANALLARLQDAHGAVTFHAAGRFGGSLTCLPEGELRLGVSDQLMGEFRGAKLYMMEDEARMWRGLSIVISTAKGPTRGFSLEAGSGYHFVLLPILLEEQA